MTALPVKSETCDSTFSGRRAVTFENFVELVVMRKVLKLQSKVENHMDGSGLQNGDTRKAMLAVMVLSSSSDMATSDAVGHCSWW